MADDPDLLPVELGPVPVENGPQHDQHDQPGHVEEGVQGQQKAHILCAVSLPVGTLQNTGKG